MSLSSRLEMLFVSSFPQTSVHSLDQDVLSLQGLLGPAEDPDPPGGEGLLCNR